MKPKKNKKADLNNYTTTFFLLGLVAMLFISWKVIELKTEDKIYEEEKGCMFPYDDDGGTTEVYIEQPKPEPIPKKVELIDIDIQDDNEEVNAPEFISTEDDDNTPTPDPVAIETDDNADDDIQTDVPFQFIQQAPTYPGCEGKKAEKLKKCVAEKIRNFVGNKFDKELASELGISGKIKIMTQFTINKQGNIVDIKTRSKYKELAGEAKKVIHQLPKMTPGMQRNLAVNVTYTLPIIFKIEEE